MLSPLEIMEAAVKALDSKKGRDIKVLCTKNITVLADYFIICTASSATQSKTLADELGRVLSEMGEPPRRTEGYRNGGWVLVDCGCVIVHLFLDEVRKFYALERLWGDAPEADVSALITE